MRLVLAFLTVPVCAYAPEVSAFPVLDSLGGGSAIVRVQAQRNYPYPSNAQRPNTGYPGMGPTAPGQNGAPRSPPKVPDVYNGGPVRDAPNKWMGTGNNGSIDKYRGNGIDKYRGNGVDKYQGNGIDKYSGNGIDKYNGNGIDKYRGR